MSTRQLLLDAVHDMLDELADRIGGPRTLAECDGRLEWPQRGVYFFYEPGEYRADGTRSRDVRVGTHALRRSSSTLWKRLAAHRGTSGGSLAGGGNHRGSIFRLHLGEALLATGQLPAEIAATWGKGSTAPSEIRRAEQPLECAVSAYIRAMPFLWVEVDDPATPNGDRGIIETGAIALLSSCARPPIDAPSSGWLGHRLTRAAIRESGLWNLRADQDLADRRAAAVARERATSLREQAPVKTIIGRMLGAHTEERAWRVGAKGEERVGDRLDVLVRKDPRWRVLHSIQIGAQRSDIDHLVIGPAGSSRSTPRRIRAPTSGSPATSSWSTGRSSTTSATASTKPSACPDCSASPPAWLSKRAASSSSSVTADSPSSPSLQM